MLQRLTDGNEGSVMRPARDTVAGMYAATLMLVTMPTAVGDFSGEVRFQVHVHRPPCH